MPTGYTADVQNGKMTSLREYALTCARAFGALIMMRDDPMDTKIPERFEPSISYHDDQIKADTKEIAQIHKMSLKSADRAARKEWEKSIQYDKDQQARENVERSRYINMRKQVQQWKVPPELSTLKEFMISQINESIQFDCGGDKARNAFHSNVPVLLSGEEWKRKQLETLSRSIAYHNDERTKEIQRTEERNKWLAALRASL